MTEIEVQERKSNLFDLLVKQANLFRDAVLHQRHQLEEPCLDNDQTNAVLELFDATIGQIINHE